jgi:hypothetical protein
VDEWMDEWMDEEVREKWVVGEKRWLELSA